MDIEDDEDFYAPEEPETTISQPPVPTAAAAEVKPVARDDLEEGEEEDESGEMDEDDSDIEIATEHKDASKAAPPPTQSKYSEIRNIPSRTPTSDTATKPTPTKDGSQLSVPPQPTSTIDVNANPVYKPIAKPIMSLNIDDDLSEKDKPWRKPGTDLSDYFNYGFDEFSWTLYADKQAKLRGEYNQDAMAERTKKMMEEMNSMIMMPGMGSSSMANMSGMDGMTPEVQAMMQQMMASGMDPSQMDPSAMAAMFAGMQNPAAAGGSGSGSAQGTGHNPNFGNQGFGGNQNQGYGGYDQGGGGMNRGGGFGGGGRGNKGGRRNW